VREVEGKRGRGSRGEYHRKRGGASSTRVEEGPSSSTRVEEGPRSRERRRGTTLADRGKHHYNAGGQTPLYRRLPKLVGRPPGPGHTHEQFSLVKLGQLAEVAPNSEVDYASLMEAGLATKKKETIYKVVGGDGTVPAGLTVKAHAFTKSAQAAIEGAGGKCVLLSKTTQEPIAA